MNLILVPLLVGLLGGLVANSLFTIWWWEARYYMLFGKSGLPTLWQAWSDHGL